MVNKKSNFKLFQIISLILLVLMAIPFAISLGDVNLSAYADPSANTVFFEQANVEAGSNGLIYVELSAEGVAGNEVSVTYHTESITAIPGIDYENITNTVKLKIGSNGKVVYKIALKCINTAANREKLRVYKENSTDIYGRRFKVKIDSADNATILDAKKECVC